MEKSDILKEIPTKDVYIVDCGSEGYKLTQLFLSGNKDVPGKKEYVQKRLEELEKKGMIVVNTLTSMGKKGPNLVCIDADVFSRIEDEKLLRSILEEQSNTTVTNYIEANEELENKENYEEDNNLKNSNVVTINKVKDPSIVEHRNVEDLLSKGHDDAVPAGDVTIWDPNKTRIMGLMFSNSAPTIILRSDNGKVGMGVLVRQNITTQLFDNIKKIMGGNVTLEVISSTMGEYPAIKEDGTELLPDASNKNIKYTLPQYIADVAHQVGIECNYDNCINTDEEHNNIFKTGEKGDYGFKNTPFIFDPSGLLEDNPENDGFENEGPEL